MGKKIKKEKLFSKMNTKMKAKEREKFWVKRAVICRQRVVDLEDLLALWRANAIELEEAIHAHKDALEQAGDVAKDYDLNLHTYVGSE